MLFQYEDRQIEVIIEKKKTTKHTYIRVKKDGKIYVSTNYFTTNKQIEQILTKEYKSIVKMIQVQDIKKENSEGFNYLGKHYDIVYVTYCDFSLGEDRAFMSKDYDIDKWYKKQAKVIFKHKLDECYEKFSVDIPYPSLRIRKMTTRWGVCNTRDKVVTLNLELIKRDVKYLEYVIMHELSHLIHPNHSANFWKLVEQNCPDYKTIKKEMKLF